MTDTIESPAAVTTFNHFIAGQWCPSTSGATFESRNPADTRDVIGRFQQGTKADVAMAIKAAETALPMWRRTPAPKRGEILYRFGALMAEHKERLSRAMTREMGKVLAEARGDVQEGIDIAFLMAGEGRRMFGETVPSELPDKWAMSIRQPLGIAGIITPWNFPIAIPCWKTMPALVTGNTVVFKPSSDTPHCATLVVELMAEAGFPPGVVNLVTGSGAEVGDAIVESPDVSVISFTGSSTTGKVLAEKAGRRLKRLSLELGGKNGVVVLADADLDLAADGILWSAFGTTGQRCTACSRVIVERSVVEPLLERLERRARGMRLGSGLDETTDVGPLINAGAVDKVAGYIDVGRGEGELITGGGRATGDGLEHGHFFEPTIFNGVKPMDRIGQEEIFGPVLSIIPVADYQEAMTALNQTRYGLSSSIFTRDVNVAFRAMRDFETGIVYINAGTTGRRDASAVRWLEGDRQRPSRGRPRRPRHVYRVEGDLRRLQRPPATSTNRQPVTGEAGLDELPDHVRRNRAEWDRWAVDYVANGERSWKLGPGEEKWGVWDIPESSLRILPDDLDGLDTIELGCGTGYVSAWLARRGARPVGIDNSEAQLATARRLQAEHGIEFPLIHGNAENVPLPDASFDLAISEYGASIWADPYRWVPEAARLLRPGGRLMFLVNGLILTLCSPDAEEPASDRMVRPYFGIHRLEWSDDESVNFYLGYGDWIRLLRSNGFDVEDLVELRPAEDATTDFPYVTLDWARQWPSEEVWKARKRG